MKGCAKQMQGSIGIILSVLIFVFSGISDASNQDIKVGMQNDSSVTSQEIKAFSNDSIFEDLLMQARGQFGEDLNQSSYILDEFVRKNISGRDAMIATSSLFVMTSHTMEKVENSAPSEKYLIYRNNTLQGLKALREYLWNMAKFYETNKISYAIQARDNFNKSLYYYGKKNNT